MEFHLAGITTKTVSFRLFFRPIFISAPTAKPLLFVNKHSHFVPSVRYRLAGRLPAMSAPSKDLPVTLINHLQHATTKATIAIMNAAIVIIHPP